MSGLFLSHEVTIFASSLKNQIMKAYVFPGQGAQFSGMGKDLYDSSDLAKQLFAQANEILGFDIQKIMFEGSDEELKQTKVTQPAIFLHSTILAACLGDSFKPDMVAGHWEKFLHWLRTKPFPLKMVCVWFPKELWLCRQLVKQFRQRWLLSSDWKTT